MFCRCISSPQSYLNGKRAKFKLYYQICIVVSACCVQVLRGHGADVKCVDWHPQKGIIVSGSKDSQQPIKLWDPKTGQVRTLAELRCTLTELHRTLTELCRTPN